MVVVHMQCGEERKLAEQLMREHELSPHTRDALLNMMSEFIQNQL